MRTNIILNDELVREAMRYSNARTKRALVEEALETFVLVKSMQQGAADYLEGARKLEARLGRLVLRESPARLLRADRDTR